MIDMLRSSHVYMIDMPKSSHAYTIDMLRSYKCTYNLISMMNQISCLHGKLSKNIAKTFIKFTKQI